jgi:heptaprenyl diphosphate synthase
MTSIHSNLEEIFLHLQQTTKQTYLRKKLGEPQFPSLFIQILHLMLTSTKVDQTLIFTYSVSSAFLRMGLTVHEQVSLQEELNREETEKRQLTILAGDYYSSLFYKTLATRGEIEGMRFLSDVASHIFEVSMTHHLKKTYDPIKQEEWTSNHLLTALADFFHVREHFIWCTLLTYFLYKDHQLPAKITRENLDELIQSINHDEVRAALYLMLHEREEVAN